MAIKYIIDNADSVLTAQTINSSLNIVGGVSATTVYVGGQPVVPGGGGLEGTSYILVTANGTPTENAAELQAAYNQAKTMSPSSANTITVIAAPGEYQFPTTFVMDTEYINLVSLTGNKDVIFDLEGITDPFQIELPSYNITNISECLLINADNVYVKGIKGKIYLSPEWDNYWGGGEEYPLPIQVADNLPNIIVENCEGGIYSFGGDITFGSNPINVNGTFINCTGKYISFAPYGVASGTFIDCTMSEPLLDTSSSFGGDGTASGIFINCIGGLASFGSYGPSSGTFQNCVGGNNAFGGFSGIASGTFTNCVGGNQAFGRGAGGATLTGKLYYCRLTTGIFQTVSSGGRTYYCIDGNGNVNNQ